MPNDPQYFATGDKLRKMFAIETARFFWKVPLMESFAMQIVSKGMDFRLSITRAEIEKYYKIRFSTMTEEQWRENYIKKYDSKKSRMAFCTKYVRLKK